MSTADINAINQSLANIQSSFNDITGNTLSNYNQLSRIVSQQGNIYNTIYFGLGNLSTGNLNFTGNLFQNGSPYIGSQWTTLNGNIYYSSGNVGIKKTTPNFELDVNGNINLSGNLFQNGSPYIASQWTTSGSNIYYNVANGNVGIGTTTPYYALDIGGSANISSNVYCMNMFIINDCLVQGGDFSIMNGNLTVYKQFNTFGESVLNGNLTVYNADFYNYGNSYVYNGLYLNKNGALYTNNDVAGQHAFYSFDTVNLMSTLYGGADDTNRVGYFQARGYGGGLPLLLNPNGGNVGVGTGNPNTTLDVNGSVSISGVCYSSGSGSTYLNGNQLNAEYNTNATAELAINYSGYLGGSTQFRDTTFFNGKNTIIAKLVGSSGNLGLGTTSPTAKLDVNGSVNVSGQMRGIWQAVTENSSITSTTDYSFSNNFRELKIICRDLSTSAGPVNIRLAFKSGVTAVTHSGVSMGHGTSNFTYTWNVAYTVLGNPVAAETTDFVIRVHYMGIQSGTYFYVVDGVGNNSLPYTQTTSGTLSYTSLIDNLSFTVSSGSYDDGRISIYATYF